MRRLAPLSGGPASSRASVQVTTSTGVHDFGVWIAADDRSRDGD